MEINSQLEKNRARLLDLCTGHHVRLLYLIGSQARGQALVMSDVDFGVTFDSRIPTNKRGESLESLSADLMKIVGRNDVDLVDLDRAPAPRALTKKSACASWSISVAVLAADPAEAVHVGNGFIRDAVHAAGIGTPGWSIAWMKIHADLSTEESEASKKFVSA